MGERRARWKDSNEEGWVLAIDEEYPCSCSGTEERSLSFSGGAKSQTAPSVVPIATRNCVL